MKVLTSAQNGTKPSHQDDLTPSCVAADFKLTRGAKVGVDCLCHADQQHSSHSELLGRLIAISAMWPFLVQFDVGSNT
jgi:hypothetical protein